MSETRTTKRKMTAGETVRMGECFLTIEEIRGNQARVKCEYPPHLACVMEKNRDSTIDSLQSQAERV